MYITGLFLCVAAKICFSAEYFWRGAGCIQFVILQHFWLSSGALRLKELFMQPWWCSIPCALWTPNYQLKWYFSWIFEFFGPTGKQQHVLTRTLMLSLGLATLSVFYIFRQFLFQVLAGPVPFLADVQIWIFISGIYRRCIIHDPLNILLFLINGSYANYWFFDSKFFEPFASWFIIICSIQPSICIELARFE